MSVRIEIAGWSVGGEGPTVDCGKRLSGTFTVVNQTRDELKVATTVAWVKMASDERAVRLSPPMAIYPNLPMPFGFDVDIRPDIPSGQAFLEIRIVLTTGAQYAATYPVTIRCK